MMGVFLYASLGLIVGGFLNVLADDLPGGYRPGKPRCMACGGQRPLLAWLSTLSYLFTRGRCPNCTAHVPLRGVFVELGTATAFGYLYAHFGLTLMMLLLSVYAAILGLITVIDLEHRLVLNVVIGPAILLALIVGPFTPDLGWKRMLLGGLVGFMFFYITALLWPGAMGWGDVKLAAFVGLVTGFPVIIVSLLVTLLAGGVISFLLLVTRIRSRRDYIPYGPFLVIGAIVGLLWGALMVDAYIKAYQDEPEKQDSGIFIIVQMEIKSDMDSACTVLRRGADGRDAVQATRIYSAKAGCRVALGGKIRGTCATCCLLPALPPAPLRAALRAIMKPRLQPGIFPHNGNC